MPVGVVVKDRMKIGKGIERDDICRWHRRGVGDLVRLVVDEAKGDVFDVADDVGNCGGPVGRRGTAHKLRDTGPS